MVLVSERQSSTVGGEKPVKTVCLSGKVVLK